MSSRRKIARNWSKVALVTLKNPRLPESTVWRLFTEGLRYKETGEDVCRAACRHPNLSKKLWLYMWLDPDFRYAAEANPMLALWLIEDPTYLERQKAMRRTYPEGKNTRWVFKMNGDLSENPAAMMGRMLREQMRETGITRALLRPENLPMNPSPSAVLSPPPPPSALLRLRELLEVNRIRGDTVVFSVDDALDFGVDPDVLDDVLAFPELEGEMEEGP